MFTLPRTRHYESSLKSLLFGILLGAHASVAAFDLPSQPLFLNSASEPPLILLNMSRDHRLSLEAYNDYSDLNGDGALDIYYNPTSVNYLGLFGSNICYVYNSTDERFKADAVTNDKKCSGAGQWSGDWLNYMTTSRIDALRMVLYGGKRVTDTSTLTVLERQYIPQDIHTWGKKYTSGGTVTLEENVALAATLSANGGSVSQSSDFDSTYLATNAIDSGTSGWDTSSLTAKSNEPYWDIDLGLIQDITTISIFPTPWDIYGLSSGHVFVSDVPFTGTSVSSSENQAGVTNQSVGTVTSETTLTFNRTSRYIRIQRTGNDKYLGLAEVQVKVDLGPTTLPTPPYDLSEYTPLSNPVAGKNVLFASTTPLDHPDFPHPFVDEPLLRVMTNSTHDVLDWVGREVVQGNEGCGNNGAQGDPCSDDGSIITDYVMRVEVCSNPAALESFCKQYPDGNYKPVGLLHDYGEDDRMQFGLLSGSYTNNTQGGILRKKIGSFTDEVGANTGVFTNINGIVNTINKFEIIGYRDGSNNDGSYSANNKCPTTAFSNGECPDWGNPVGEMIYEGLRYLAGKGTPTNLFKNVPSTTAGTNDYDADMGLANITNWGDPYDTTGAGACAGSPFQMVISDTLVSFDSDSLPGVYNQFGSGISGDLSGFDTLSLASTITSNEPDIIGSHIIGQSNTVFDDAPSAKNVTSLGQIRGLPPEEPAKQGSYSAAMAAYYGKINDLNPVSGTQKANIMAVALASPVPRVEVPIGSNTITLVPFSKTVEDASTFYTGAIVDFFIVDTANTNSNDQDNTVNGGRWFMEFMVNFADNEQGTDYDMDAITRYKLSVTAANTLEVNLTPVHSAGGLRQHSGYIISGTTDDGIKLVVRDTDSYIAHPLDIINPLTLVDTSTYTPSSSTTAATILNDPLWYAAKWGGFQEAEGDENNLPDKTSEWDADNDGDPDNYFLVTNPTEMQSQLTASLDRIIEIVGASAASVAVSTTTLQTNTSIFQAKFNTADWDGDITATPLNSDGTLGTQIWSAATVLDGLTETQIVDNRAIFTLDDSDNDANTADVGTDFKWANISTALQTELVFALNLNYLRGSRVDEVANGGGFRDRASRLGDIIDSSPLTISNENYNLSSLPGTEGSTYSAYVNTKTTRFNISGTSNTKSVVYVGANDGMLHAFNSEDGTEEFAYIPRAVQSKLKDLAETGYSHQYYVNGSTASFDAYIDADGPGASTTVAWRTLLTGALGYGGRGIYALDITDPYTADKKSMARWEFTSADNAEVGYVLSKPIITRLKIGSDAKWAVIFGNGYNSDSNKAQLFILDATDGSLIRVIDTETGDSSNPNGLSQPALIDSDGDSIVDTAYAGDLLGNMWKFDLTGNNAGQLDVALKSGNTPKPLFTAEDPDGGVQAITSAPAVVKGPDDGFVVLFGSGKFFATGDNILADPPKVASVYGILDNGSDAVTFTTKRDDVLVEQEIIFENAVGVAVSDNTVDYGSKKGWFMDLDSPDDNDPNTNLEAKGDRVIAPTITRFGRVIFATFRPPSTVCGDDVLSRIFEMDALSGARLEYSVFDADGDGDIDEDDYITLDDGTEVPMSGKEIPATIAPISVIPTQTHESEFKLTSGTTGEITATLEKGSLISLGRQSWRQLK
jgi:type IV pilus assembly protein PilY1